MRLPAGQGGRGGTRRRADDADAAPGTYGPSRTRLVGGGDQREYRPDYPRRRPVQRRRYRRGRGAVRRRPAISVPALTAVAFVACVVLVVAGVELSRGSTNAAAPAAATVLNPNCTLIVPENPLSPRGLATPYLLTATDPAEGACHEANPGQTAFVQG